MTPSHTPKFGLVLQGGGALGAYEAGAIRYLLSTGAECVIASGASSGAMNAATIAGAKTTPAGALLQLWNSLATDPPIPYLPPIISKNWSMLGVPGMYRPRRDYWTMPTWTSCCDTRPFRAMLERTLNWDQIRDPRNMRLIVSATGVEDAETRYFTNMDPSITFGPEHVLASGSLPPGFPATQVEGKNWWDGGLTDNTPLKPVIEALTGDEAETLPIYVLDVNCADAPAPTTLTGALSRMLEILIHNNLAGDSETARAYTRFIRVLRQVDRQLPAIAAVRDDPDWKTVMDYAHVHHIHYVEILKPAGDSASDFSHDTITRRLQDGYQQMEASIND